MDHLIKYLSKGKERKGGKRRNGRFGEKLLGYVEAME